MANETYYVSKESTNGYVVGNDTNNGLTKATAFLTLDKGSDTCMLASGDVTMIINDGIFIGTDISTSNYWLIGANPAFDSLTIKPENANFVTIIPNSTVALLRFNNATGWDNTKTVTIQDLILGRSETSEGGLDPNYCIWTLGGATTAPTLNLTRITTKNHTVYAVYPGLTAKINIVITDLVHESNRNPGRAYYYSPTHSIGGLTINGGTINHTRYNHAGFGIIYHDADTTGVTCNIDNLSINAGVNPPDVTADAIMYGMFIANIDDAVVHNSTVVLKQTASGAGWGLHPIRMFGNDATLTAARQKIEKCTAISLGGNAPSGGGFGITIGGDGASRQDNVSDDSFILNCTFIGDAIYAANNGHGIGIVANDNCIVAGNTVSYADIGFLAKLTATNLFVGNLAFSCGGGPTSIFYYNKGGTNDDLFFNTVVIDINSDCTGFVAAIDGATNTTGLELKSNLILVTADTTKKLIMINASQTATFDYNHFYVASGVSLPTNPCIYQSTSYATVTAWITARETNGIEITNNPVNNDNTLKKGAVGVNGGDNTLVINRISTGFNGEPFPLFDRDIGGAPTTFGSFHPVNL